MSVRIHRPVASAVAVASLALLAACATPMQEERVVYSSPVQRAPISADYGRVEGISMIEAARRPSGAGAILGAVLGGVLGNQFGKGSGRAVATVGGAVAGGVAGNAVEGRTRGTDELYHVTVRFDNGTFREFDFREIGDLRTGDRVKLEDGQIHRV